jgi:hypothetical protein
LGWPRAAWKDTLNRDGQSRNNPHRLRVTCSGERLSLSPESVSSPASEPSMRGRTQYGEYVGPSRGRFQRPTRATCRPRPTSRAIANPARQSISYPTRAAGEPWVSEVSASISPASDSAERVLISRLNPIPIRPGEGDSNHRGVGRGRVLAGPMKGRAQ